MGIGFDVWLMAFEPSASHPEAALADAFGLERRKAKKLVESLPKVVKRGVSQAAALQYADALRRLGAKVEVRAGMATGAYPANSLSKTTGDDTPGETTGRPRRATLGDGPEGTSPAKLGQIVEGGNAPYAWLTHSLMGWIMLVVGAGILAVALLARSNAFVQVVDLPDVLLAWLGTALLTIGAIEGIHGVTQRRSLDRARNVRLAVSVLWLAVLVGLQAAYGNPLLG